MKQRNQAANQEGQENTTYVYICIYLISNIRDA